MKTMELVKKISLATAIFILIFAIGENASAFKMNIDPPRVALLLNPGEEKGGYISVLNYHDYEPMHVKVYANDLVYLPDGSNDFLPERTTPWSVADWLKIGPTEFDLPAGEEMKVRYIVSVPKSVTGGRYGVVFFEVSPPLEQLKGKTGAAINVRLGSIFLVTVKGTEVYAAELQDLRVGPPDKDGAFDIYCAVKNDGNVLIRPNGPIKIIDSAKNEIVSFKLNEQKSGVLPDTSRQFSVRYDKGKLTPGEYFVQIVLDYGGKDYLGGQIGFKIK